MPRFCPPVARDKRDKGGFFGKNCNPSTGDAKRALWSSGPTMAAYATQAGVDIWATEWYAPTELPSRPTSVQVHHKLPFDSRQQPALLGSNIRVVTLLRNPVNYFFSLCQVNDLPTTNFTEGLKCFARPHHVNYVTMRIAACDPSWRTDPSLAQDLPSVASIAARLAACEDAAPEGPNRSHPLGTTRKLPPSVKNQGWATLLSNEQVRSAGVVRTVHWCVTVGLNVKTTTKHSQLPCSTLSNPTSI